MICKRCKTEMIIDEWDGWKWACYNCEKTGRKATKEDIEKQEQEYIEFSKQFNPESYGKDS